MELFHKAIAGDCPMTKAGYTIPKIAAALAIPSTVLPVIDPILQGNQPRDASRDNNPKIPNTVQPHIPRVSQEVLKADQLENILQTLSGCPRYIKWGIPIHTAMIARAKAKPRVKSKNAETRNNPVPTLPKKKESRISICHSL
jgi:hypothetical protein